MLEEEGGIFGCFRCRLRSGELVVALRIERRLPVSSWRFGGRLWVVRKAGKRLEGKFGFGVDFGRELAQVFAVERFACGEGEGRRSGASGRWLTGE